MDKLKLIYSIIIIILYIPLVFLGVNVFFPEYTAQNSYFYNDCYLKVVQPESIREINNTETEKCIKEQEKLRLEFEKNKNAYESKKYIAVTLFNLVVLILTLFLPLDVSILLGLFTASTLSTFISTVRYFNTNSKIGFVILVVIFIATIYIINKYKDKLLKG